MAAQSEIRKRRFQRLHQSLALDITSLRTSQRSPDVAPSPPESKSHPTFSSARRRCTGAALPQTSSQRIAMDNSPPMFRSCSKTALVSVTCTVQDGVHCLQPLSYPTLGLRYPCLSLKSGSEGAFAMCIGFEVRRQFGRESWHRLLLCSIRTQRRCEMNDCDECKIFCLLVELWMRATSIHGTELSVENTSKLPGRCK